MIVKLSQYDTYLVVNELCKWELLISIIDVMIKLSFNNLGFDSFIEELWIGTSQKKAYIRQLMYP